MMAKPRTQIYADLPHDLNDADELLQRYGQWAIEHSSGGGRCGSAEGNYRAERGDALEARREPKQVGLHTDVALRCQRALISVPDRERIVLTILYVPKRLPIEAQLRLLRIPPALSQERHKLGVRMFWNRYQILEQQALDKTKGCRAYNTLTSQVVSVSGA